MRGIGTGMPRAVLVILLGAFVLALGGMSARATLFNVAVASPLAGNRTVFDKAASVAATSPYTYSTASTATSSLGVSGGERAQPVRIEIPSLAIEADIESVGKDETGAMDTPAAVENVAWYNLGSLPGGAGNAVISGHLDRRDGSPAVFWELDRLEPGDLIVVEMADGALRQFVVTRVVAYAYDAAPLDEIFGLAFHSNLNLITCQGTWDAGSSNYSERLVVYSRLVSSSAEVAVD